MFNDLEWSNGIIYPVQESFTYVEAVITKMVEKMKCSDKTTDLLRKSDKLPTLGSIQKSNSTLGGKSHVL